MENKWGGRAFLGTASTTEMTSACICWLNPGPAMSLLFVVIYPRLITLNHALPSDARPGYVCTGALQARGQSAQREQTSGADRRVSFHARVQPAWYKCPLWYVFDDSMM